MESLIKNWNNLEETIKKDYVRLTELMVKFEAVTGVSVEVFLSDILAGRVKMEYHKIEEVGK